MEVLVVSQGVLKFGSNILNTIKISNKITELEESIYSLYKDISKVHFSSALQSLENAPYSNNPDTEIRAAIHHLYDSFFSLYNLLEKIVEKKNLLLFSHNEDYVKYKEDIYIPCLKITALIIDLYSFLEEENEAKNWKQYMKGMYERSYTIYSNILTIKEEEKRGINKLLTLVNEYEKEFARLHFSDDINEISEIEYDRLRHICKDYAISMPIPSPIPRYKSIKYYTYYFITKRGLDYVNNIQNTLKEIAKTYNL